MLLTPERCEAAIPAIRQALTARLAVISHEPVRLPGEDGMEQLLSPAERLAAKIGQEMEFIEQGSYFNGIEYYLPYLYPEGATLLDYLPENTAVILDEPEHTAHAFHRFHEGLEQLETSRLNRGALLPNPYRSICRSTTDWRSWRASPRSRSVCCRPASMPASPPRR